LGIHTRFPIIKHERIEYSSLANGSVAWWLKVGNDTLLIVNNHFESCHLNNDDRAQYRQIIKGELPSDSARTESKVLLIKLAEANAKRSEQIRTVLRYVEEHSQYPIIVCGDFNDNPISYSRHAMAERLTDCFRETGRGVGLSYNQKAFSLRIDHIFCSQQLQPYNCKIDDEMDASDHYPILCWLKMQGK
jgi:endonuclease/exonuclease/phosphatase family metal-dependent hydrolase